MKVIAVTGTPGAGKTTISKLLSKKLNFYYVDVNKIITQHKLSEGYDKKRKTKIVDVGKLNRAVINEIKEFGKKKIKGIIIDSHLSHYLPRKYVDFCIVAKCNIRELSKRLKKKKFGKGKMQENLQAEIFGICHDEAVQRKHNIIIVDTAKGFNIQSLANRLGG